MPSGVIIHSWMTPDYWEEIGVIDPIILVLTLLKSKWSLSGEDLSGSNIKFSTGWFDNRVMFPQITITPGWNIKQPLTTGLPTIYRFEDTILVNVWVRPRSDSNTSLGTAKNVEYQVREEIDRILKSGSRLVTNETDQEFIYPGRWVTRDETATRPILLRSELQVKNNYFKERYDEA